MNNFNLHLKYNQIFTIKRFVMLCSFRGIGIQKIEIGTKLKYKGKVINPILQTDWIKVEMNEIEYIINPKALIGFDYSKKE